jgi:cytoskeleton protein RodZ
LRAARLRQGLQLPALAAIVKVPPAKLEALEADHHEVFPDATFTRALAKTLCRVLKIEAAPVLALLPQGGAATTMQWQDTSLGRPFKDPRVAGEPLRWAPWQRPVPWAVAVLLAAAAAFVLVPTPQPVLEAADEAASAAAAAAAEAPPEAASALAGLPAVAASAVAAPVAVAASAAGGMVAQAASSVASAVGVIAGAVAPASAAAVSAPVAAGVASASASASVIAVAGADPADRAVLRVTADAWIQVSDGRGKVLAGRLFKSGEVVEFNAPLPLRVRVGNVAGTELAFRGQPVDLRSGAQGNVRTVVLQ